MIEITEKDLQDVPLDDEYTAMLESQGEEATKAFYICNAFKYLHLAVIGQGIIYCGQKKEMCD